MRELKIGVNTNVLVAQLKVIAEHTTALVKELETICPACGGKLLENGSQILEKKGIVYEYLVKQCFDCGEKLMHTENVEKHSPPYFPKF
ncbi:hypothetical protein [Heyndrickxia oleronia]|uniref:hypothetical protein n=1 Tax=Heyndrickxia oleronia TaxID=38875 RepID=UPI001C0F0669|nr:hypothetical protein [Heyndrickxia oleronia]MBU5214496.1 hypothetical protein [Heyndrickxia oleronia]